MLAFKEFADFVTLNMANLAATFSRLLGEQSPSYAAISPDSRTATGRKLLNAVVEACQEQTSDPLVSLFKENTQQTVRRWPANITPSNPLTEIECLGQTLTPVVTNLEAGKFLWQTLSEIRTELLNSSPLPSKPVVVRAERSTASGSSSLGQNQEISLFGALIDNLPDIIFMKDTEGHFLLANDALRRQLGAASVEDIVGKTDYDFNPKELADQYRADDRKLMELGESIIAVEEPIYDHETGITGWVSTTKIPFHDGEGNIAGIMGLVRDITELKTAQVTLSTRIKELNYLNELGRQIEEAPVPSELLQWATERLPAAMQHPDLCEVAITFNDVVYGVEEAIEIPSQMTHGLYIGGQVQGRVYVAYTQKQDFLNEESALLGAVATRISVFLENQKLFNDMQSALAQAKILANEQTVLTELGQALTAQLNIEQILEEAYRQTSRLVDTTNFYIGLYDKENHQIKFSFDVTESEIDRALTVISADEGLAGHIVKNRAPLLFEDNVAAHEESLGISVVGQEPESWLGVPLMLGNEVLGVMAVQSYTTPRLYNEHSRDLLTAIANQAAIALQNARQFEETQAALAETQTLYQAGAAFNAAQSYNELLEVVRQYTIANRAPSVSLGYFTNPVSVGDDLPNSFDILASWRPGIEEAFKVQYTLDEFPSFVHLARSELTLIEDISQETFLDENLKVVFDDAKAKTVLYAPIIAAGQWVGFLSLIYQEKETFSQAELQRVTAVTAQLSSALQNLYNFKKAQTSQREAQILQQLAQTLTGSLQINEVINAFFNAAQQLLGVDFSVFSLVDAQRQRVRAIDGYNVTANHIRLANHPLDSDDIMADIIRTGQTEIIRGTDPRFDQDIVAAEGMETWGLRIFTPITVRQENIGLIEIGFKENVDVAVEETQVQLLKTLVDQVAISLDNAQSYQASQQTARREQTIREITEKMRSAVNLEDLVKVTAQELGQRFSVEYTLVDLGIETAVLPAGNGKAAPPDDK